MARNLEPVKPMVSASESSEEEDPSEAEEEPSEEEDESPSDGEPKQTQVTHKPSPSTSAALKKSQPPTISKPQEPNSSDEETSGSESETDSDGPGQNIKPITPKPENLFIVSSKKNYKPNSVTPNKLTGGKRPSEEKETDAKDVKRSKNPEAENSEKKTNDDSRKLLFQRLWSEDDEIVILKGMLDFASEKKIDPVTDLQAFHDYIKKNLHVDVSRTQLQDKIRRLKKKYKNNQSKETDGKDRTFSKVHEQTAYDLSKMIWANENWKDSGGKKPQRTPSKKPYVTEDIKTTKDVNDNGETQLIVKDLSSYGLRAEDSILRIGAELFEEGRGLEGEKQWKKLKLDEIEAYWKQMAVKTAQAKLVLDTLKSLDD